MSLSLIHHKLPLSSSSSSSFFNLQPSISPKKPSFPIHSKNPSSLSLTTPPSSTPTPIFLPLFEQHEQEAEQNQKSYHDPIYKFFKTRTMVSSQNSSEEGKSILPKNPRTTSQDPDEEEEEEEAEMGSQKKESPLSESVVGEILHLARNLPQHLTLEEALVGYEKRVSEKVCLEVMEILGEEQLFVCCLYLFQWMRSQEPSLVTPKVFTVLFPLLGRSRMGDKLMVLFRNLPSSKEFRNVCVYNAAISGLLSDGRYLHQHFRLKVEAFLFS